MDSRAKKQTDIVLMGEGDFIGAVQNILHYMGAKTMSINNVEDVHFVGKGIFVHGGERIGARRFMIVAPLKPVLPAIKGIGSTRYAVLTKNLVLPKSESVTILGGGELAVNAAVKYSLLGSAVDLAYSSDVLLEQYDMSVQDVVSRYLRKRGVKVYKNHTALASITKDSNTQVLLTSAGKPKKLVCKSLLIEPERMIQSDLGLANHGYTEADNLVTHVLSSNVLVTGRESDNFSIYDAEQAAKSLMGRSKLKSNHVIDHDSSCSTMRYFSIGVLEQNLMGSHIGYKKSLAKIASADLEVIGFIKAITTLTGKIIGLSGVFPDISEDIQMLRYTVRNRLHIKDFAKLIPVGDPLVTTYSEIIRELS